jgi:hypothetical protein
MARSVTNGLDLRGQRILGVGAPSATTDAATKAYVDAQANGLDWKASVRAASTGNIDLTAPGGTIDGVTMAVGDRFLAKDQTSGPANGIYVWSGALVAAVRAGDADSDAEVTAGMTTFVTEGTTNADKQFVLITNDPITLGTTALVFSQAGGGTPIIAGAGLTKTGDTLDIGQGTGVIVTADAIAIDPAIVARKFAANVGDGTATAIIVSHGFGSRDVTVALYTNAAPFDEVIADVEHTDASTITLRFATAPAAGAYRCVVTG